MAYNFTTIERKWQQHWLRHKTFRAYDPAEKEAHGKPKAYVLDMFPYPSGAGLHVGHPEGYTATDIVSRYLRMRGYNVLHPMGWDAFGLPAEQYAVKTNQHPRITTQKNVNKFREQIQSLGLSYDWDREVDTTDPRNYKWTQWIFLQLFNSYFDPVERKAGPIEHLAQQLRNSGLPLRDQQAALDRRRLAYMDEVPVNWCPALGTVLANEEVIDGKSEVGGFPVERRPMRQWMLRITAYADRLLEDLDALEWPESLKEMQRNWIGRSVGAEVDFAVAPPVEPNPSARRVAGLREDQQDGLKITVFTTRPDTLYGATYMVLAPEHPLVDRITPPQRRETVEAYRAQIAGKTDRDRMAEAKEKTGCFTGAYAINPVNKELIPIYIADYVLMGYGTGAIMAVPAHDERDFEFAKKFDLPIRAVVMPVDAWLNATAVQWFGRAEPIITRDGKPATLNELEPAERKAAQEWVAGERARMSAEAKSRVGDQLEALRENYAANPGGFGVAFTGDGVAINSKVINGLPTPQAKEKIAAWLEERGLGKRSVNYKLRDWLFSRQRYWGEPFPLLHDAETGQVFPVDESELPVLLPEVEDFRPRPTSDTSGEVVPPLGRAGDWQHVWGRVENGRVRTAPEGTPGARKFRRELNTMPQWAGSCWYYLRYIDPHNDQRFVDPAKERYFMPVDLYVGGVEHAVLHLLYSRFWHKVLFDLGHVATVEPFKRLVNQGLILGEMEYHAFYDEGGRPVSASDVVDMDEEATESGVHVFAFHKKTRMKLAGRRLSEEEVEQTKEGFRLRSDASIRLDARSFKMSKSRGNVVNPDKVVENYGADAFRLYEMYMGPLEAQKPWNTRDIVGMTRFLNAVWRNLVGDEESGKVASITDEPIPDALDRMMHRTIRKVGEDIAHLRFNTAIAELIKLNNETGRLPSVPRKLAETFVLLLSPFAPHLAEELWQRLGHSQSLARHAWPTFDEAKLVEDTMELPVQVNGKLRGKVTVAAGASQDDILQAAETSEAVQPWITGKQMKKRLYVPKKLVNFVVA